MKKVKEGFVFLIYGLAIMSLLLVIMVSLIWPGDNLISRQMIIGVLSFFAAFILAMKIWEKVWISLRTDKLIFLIFLLFYGVFLYVISCVGRNSSYSFYDYGVVYSNAIELAKSNSLADGSYYLIYSNNIRPTLFLSVLFKIAYAFGVNDPFYFALFISVIEVMLAIWSTCVLTQDSNIGRILRVPVICLFMCCLPIWSNTQAFYSDSMSFAVAIVVLALLKILLKSENPKKKAGIGLVLGVLVAIGVSIKMTVGILLIAVGVVGFLLFDRKMFRKNLPGIVGGILGFCAIELAVSCWESTYEVFRRAEETANPIISWVALGMKGDGSWSANREFGEAIKQMPLKADKVAYAGNYIAENYTSFFDMEHIIQKVRHNYASGHLGSTDYAYTPINPNNIIWELFSPHGKFYWRISQISFCYVVSMYLTCLVGSIITLYQYWKYRKINAVLMITDLSMLGYFLFLLLWEANNRQLYNHVPIMILSASLHAYQVSKCMKRNKSTRVKE